MIANLDPKRLSATQLSPVMVSYAQNFEDVLLRRVLYGVVNGTYVDVGAQDAKVDSVTKWFYDCGWSGINIEPHPDYFAQLTRERPRDINLQIAVADADGAAQFCFVRESGLSSLDMGAAVIAAKHGLASEVGTVRVRTLDSVLAEHPRADIHFLKIDVEGSEAKVIASIDLSKHRPWIILIEATEPASTATTWHCFESVIVERGYQRVHFDGLNVWYLREESIALAEHFRLPPNVFDAFVRWKEHAWNLGQMRPVVASIPVGHPTQGFKTLFGR
jgi:FkbM family methyltransferase